MLRVVAILFIIVWACASSCKDAPRAGPEIVEVRWWDEGCRSRSPSVAGEVLPDTIAYAPAHRESARIVSLGGCVEEFFYVQERRFFAVLDTLGSTDSTVVWPFDTRLRLTVAGVRAVERPFPVDSALMLALYEPGTTSVAFFGFSDAFGLLWADVHQGPAFRLSRVERPLGHTISLMWDESTVLPGDVERFDSLWVRLQGTRADESR
jgi:hypothetical protein